MVTIYLARHGQDQDNFNGLLNGHRNQPLTEKGLEQAQEAATKIREAGLHFDHIYSSPLQRAHVTAQVISEAIGGPDPEVHKNLIERDFGVLTGVPVSEIEARCAPNVIKTDTITYFLQVEGAETFPQLQQRANTVLNELQTKHDGETILLVSHGDFGKMLYTAYYNLDWEDVLRKFHFGNSELLILSPESDGDHAHVFTIEQFNA